MKFHLDEKEKGFILFDALVGVFFGTIFLVAFAELILNGVKMSYVNNSQLKAKFYLQELIEVTKDLEQTPSGWQTIINTSCNDSSPCYPTTSGSDWILVSDPSKQTLENNTYTRWLTIEDVYRNPTNQIVNRTDPGAVLSTSTKKVIATITWNNGRQTSTLVTYVYKY